MAFVYRTVPSLTSTVEKFGSLRTKQENLEGILYDLGYISFENVYPFFRQNEDQMNNTFSFFKEDSKFFFLLPYDALMNTFCSIEGYCYDRFHFELLEYDIPREILLKYCGYGFYNEHTSVEFCIPESEFQRNSSNNTDIKCLADELSKQKEMQYVSDYSNKKVYKTNFITGKRNLYDVSELFDKNDFFPFSKIIEQLNQKGINCSNNIFEIYEMFKKQSCAVYKDNDGEVRKLKRNLEKVLDK